MLHFSLESAYIDCGRRDSTRLEHDDIALSACPARLAVKRCARARSMLRNSSTSSFIPSSWPTSPWRLSRDGSAARRSKLLTLSNRISSASQLH